MQQYPEVRKQFHPRGTKVDNICLCKFRKQSAESYSGYSHLCTHGNYTRGNGTKIVSRMVHGLPSSKPSLQAGQV